MPIAGGSSLQPNPPNTEFDTPSDTSNDVLQPFNADTYVLPVHIIGRGGGFAQRARAALRLYQREGNFSPINNANEMLRMWGSCPQVYDWYERLPQGAKDAVTLAGFEPLILDFHLLKAELGLTTVLVEQWWDTTKTFHFPEAGEITITLGDFALLTGLRVGGDLLPLDPQIHEHKGAFDYLLRKTRDVSESGHVTYSWLRAQYDQEGILAEVSLPQLVRAFCFYLLGQTLFCSKENSVHVQFLAALVNLDTIAEFDWGTPALATLYGHLSACSRGVSLSLAGHHHVLELRFDPWNTLLDDIPLELTSVPTDIVQEWFRAFQSVEDLVQRQHSRIAALEAEQVSTVSVTQSVGASKGGSTGVGDGGAGANDEGGRGDIVEEQDIIVNQAAQPSINRPRDLIFNKLNRKMNPAEWPID
ncbi:hypothetical protein RHMOL_Rhmol08G0165600 [Rhododendron molle]|uniref:Uncharacterized protein n=1 Tax=Rhododendron molle TaxID=49168 RepID=A0ACC0MNY5_RHOML|nr:hypothetical protein RHMOL_Rhmol08G0165600 [Rhododendron molle]